MGVDPAFDAAHTEPDPDKALALAVIQRAILDLLDAKGESETEKQVVARDAKLFLFGDGDWAASRRAWCSVADIDEGWLHRRVRAIIAGEVEFGSGKGRGGPKVRRPEAFA